jgi:hypothetical protein
LTQTNGSPENPGRFILKTATCKTLSGKSTLTYQIGCNEDSDIHLRITKNSGGGFFSDEWVAFEDIQTTLEKRRKDQAITSYLLAPVFEGKSVNTPAFLLAALANEKLVRPLKGKKREHELLDPGPFLDKVEKLMASGVKAKNATRKTTRKTTASSTKKATIKKRSVSKRKKVTTRKKTS